MHLPTLRSWRCLYPMRKSSGSYSSRVHLLPSSFSWCLRAWVFPRILSSASNTWRLTLRSKCWRSSARSSLIVSFNCLELSISLLRALERRRAYSVSLSSSLFLMSAKEMETFSEMLRVVVSNLSTKTVRTYWEGSPTSAGFPAAGWLTSTISSSELIEMGRFKFTYLDDARE